MQKTTLQDHLSYSVQKKLKKTPNIPETRRSLKWAILKKLQPMQRLWPLQNGEFGSKIKNTQKEVDNHSTKTFGMFCAKKRSKKPQILEK